MSAEIVNLRRARKTKARGDKERKAEANRAKFGRTKAERTHDEAEEKRSARHLDGVRRERPDETS